MSTLMYFTAVCEIESQIEKIQYHKRRDWERMKLRWQQDMEEIRRTGTGIAYPPPVFPSIQSIREQVYKRL